MLVLEVSRFDTLVTVFGIHERGFTWLCVPFLFLVWSCELLKRLVNVFSAEVRYVLAKEGRNSSIAVSRLRVLLTVVMQAKLPRVLRRISTITIPPILQVPAATCSVTYLRYTTNITMGRKTLFPRLHAAITTCGRICRASCPSRNRKGVGYRRGLLRFAPNAVPISRWSSTTLVDWVKPVRTYPVMCTISSTSQEGNETVSCPSRLRQRDKSWNHFNMNARISPARPLHRSVCSVQCLRTIWCGC